MLSHFKCEKVFLLHSVFGTVGFIYGLSSPASRAEILCIGSLRHHAASLRPRIRFRFKDERASEIASRLPISWLSCRSRVAVTNSHSLVSRPTRAKISGTFADMKDLSSRHCRLVQSTSSKYSSSLNGIPLVTRLPGLPVNGCKPVDLSGHTP